MPTYSGLPVRGALQNFHPAKTTSRRSGRRDRMKKLFSITTLALMLAVTASTQTSSSSIAGTVADSTNRVVPGATVTLTNEASGEARKVTTNENGEFVFAGIVPGVYTVRVESTGFRPL